MIGSGRCSLAWQALRSPDSASKEAAMRELAHSLRTACEREADYDIAATIDAMVAVDGADSDLVRQRDEILATAEDRAAAGSRSLRRGGA